MPIPPSLVLLFRKSLSKLNALHKILLFSNSKSLKFLFVSGEEPCHPYEPFRCPGNGACISIQYLCDGAPDCADGYDEDSRLCTAGMYDFNAFGRNKKREIS